MFRSTFVAALLAVLTAGCAATPAPVDIAAAREEVAATERAFAATMARRDLAGFASFLAEDTVFFSGPTPLRGRDVVVQAWARYYEGPAAPFSWEPDQVEVLDSGTLALSSGPVRDPQGKLVGRFNSIWRREAPGSWRIVFDRGEDVCPRPDAGS
jgi:ketosteroid isomerase-like protein